VRPEEWRTFLADLTTALDAEGGLIHAPPVNGAMPIPFVLHNIDPTPVLDKMAKYGRQAPFAERAATMGLAPGVFQNFAVIPPAELFETEYFREYMTPTRTGDAVQLLLRLPEQEAPALGVTVGRLIDAPPFEEEDVALGWRLYPLVRRAAMIAMEIYGSARIDPALAQAFDGFATPCLLFANSRTPLLVNAAAKELLDARDGVRFSRGLVCATAPKAQSAFNAALDRCATTQLSLTPRVGAEILLPRGEGKAPLLAVVLPLGAENPFLEWSGPARAALYLVDVESDAARLKGLRRAQKLFGLSAAEDDVLRRWLAGASVAEIAEGRRVSLDTVRKQMKALLLKTQSRRQADLHRLRALGEVGG